jgi:hypothetical protein
MHLQHCQGHKAENSDVADRLGSHTSNQLWPKQDEEQHRRHAVWLVYRGMGLDGQDEEGLEASGLVRQELREDEEQGEVETADRDNTAGNGALAALGVNTLISIHCSDALLAAP